MKVAIYARVSTDSENQLNSLDNQQKYYNDYCKKNDLKMVNMYVDEGLTGTKLKREQFLNMLHNAGLNIIQDEDGIRFRVSKREPEFEYIITKDVSRFSRNVNAIQAVKMLRKKGVYVLFEQNNIDTKDDKYEFMLNLFLNFAQQESIDRSTKVKFGLEQRAKDGKYHFGSERLYGYQYNTETKEISIIHKEAEIVKRIFDMYVNDLLGSRQIADILVKEGHKTQNDKNWNANSIVRVLKQEKYTGSVNLLKYTYGDVTDEGRQKKLKNQDEWVYKESLLPQIIDHETYQKAQKIMSSRTSDNKGTNTPRNLFSKKLKCAKCGKNYIRSNQKQGEHIYYFYACATRRRTKECDNASVTLLRLEEEMKPYQDYKLHEILTQRKNTFNKLIQSNIGALEIKKKLSHKNKDSIRSRISEIESEVDTLIDSFISSSSTVKKAVERKIEALEKEKEKLELDLINYNEATIDAEINEYINTMNHLNKRSQQKTFTLEEVLEFISQIVIDDGEIKIEFAFEKLLPTDDFTSIKDFMLDNLDKISAILKDAKDKFE